MKARWKKVKSGWKTVQSLKMADLPFELLASPCRIRRHLFFGPDRSEDLPPEYMTLFPAIFEGNNFWVEPVIFALRKNSDSAHQYCVRISKASRSFVRSGWQKKNPWASRAPDFSCPLSFEPVWHYHIIAFQSRFITFHWRPFFVHWRPFFCLPVAVFCVFPVFFFHHNNIMKLNHHQYSVHHHRSPFFTIFFPGFRKKTVAHAKAFSSDPLTIQYHRKPTGNKWNLLEYTINFSLGAGRPVLLANGKGVTQIQVHCFLLPYFPKHGGGPVFLNLRRAVVAFGIHKGGGGIFTPPSPSGGC